VSADRAALFAVQKIVRFLSRTAQKFSLREERLAKFQVGG
jgi:hypothetical protein